MGKANQFPGRNPSTGMPLRTPPPAAQPIQEDPHLMPNPDLHTRASTREGMPRVDNVPPLSYFGIADNLQLRFNLETLQHVHQTLFPSDPFTRGVLYANTLNLLNKYLRDTESL